MLELYQKEECPFCHKVRVALNDLELDFICRISKTGSAQREVMMKLGDKHQVPFLVDQEKGVMLYESDAIVEYLYANYSKIKQKTEDNTPKVCPIE
ncbi:MAG: glutathione S-transferase N-terminal domain-containing protein [Minisyncoccia bacterium]